MNNKTGDTMSGLEVFIKLVVLALLVACGNASQINGNSLKTAHKSVGFIKEHLPTNQRLEFEMAYWALRNRLKDDAEFLQTIDKKTATDLIELAKTNFAKDKAAGTANYAEYENWGQMIARQIQQRGEQDRGAIDPHDRKGYPRVDYKMHAM